MEPHQATDHPPPEQLSAFLERRLDGAERQALIEHLVECGDCRRDVASASRLLTSSRASRWRTAYPILGVIAATLVFVLLPRMQSRQVDRVAEERSQRVLEPDVVSPIFVVSPSDGAEVGRRIVLVWRSDAPSALYNVTVLDSTGTVTWRTRTADTSVTIPDGVYFPARATYYWSVDALRQDGRVTTSRAHWFTR